MTKLEAEASLKASGPAKSSILLNIFATLSGASSVVASSSTRRFLTLKLQSLRSSVFAWLFGRFW